MISLLNDRLLGGSWGLTCENGVIRVLICLLNYSPFSYNQINYLPGHIKRSHVNEPEACIQATKIFFYTDIFIFMQNALFYHFGQNK